MKNLFLIWMFGKTENIMFHVLILCLAAVQIKKFPILSTKWNIFINKHVNKQFMSSEIAIHLMFLVQ